MKIKIVWYAPEIGNASSGLRNHNKLFIEYLSKHPEVQELIVVRSPLPDHRMMPPFLEINQGIRYFTPRISMDYKGVFKSILQSDLKYIERLKVNLFKLALKFKGIKRLDLDKIRKWGMIEFGLLGMAIVQLPYPNPFLEQIGRCITKLHPDIIQSHTEFFSVAGGLARDAAKAHISYQVLVEEEKDTLQPRTIAAALLERSEDALKWLIESHSVDKYIAASEFVNKRLQERGINSNQIETIHSPIVLKHLRPISKSKARSNLNLPQNKRIILSVGRLLDRKRFIDIIKIMKYLPEDVIFYLKRSVSATDDILPSAIAQLQKEIRKNKLEKRIIINSDVIPYEDMYQIYSAADIAVFPFLYEPFGMCAAEAMAIGLPLIVYNSGYLPKFINGNGFVIEPQNLEDLKEKISYLLNEPTLAAEMGSKGQDSVKQYDIQVLGEKLINIYREFI